MNEKRNAATGAASFTGVKDIIDSILYTQLGYAFAYVRIQPFSMDLMAVQERQMFVQRITAEFSNERKPFRFLSLSRPVDVSSIINEWMFVSSQTTNTTRRRLIQQEIQATGDFALSGMVVERQFYIVLWEREEDAKQVLQRAHDMVSRMGAVGVQAYICDQREILQLCNLFANPTSAATDDINLEPTLPVLTREGIR